MRLLQTQPYKRHFYRQENSLKEGAPRPETGGPVTLAGTAMRAKGSSKKHRKGKKNKPAKKGGRALAQDRRV